MQDAPISLGYLVVDARHSTHAQTNVLHVTYSESESDSWGKNFGGSYTIGTEATVGVPAVMSGKISHSLSVSYAQNWGGGASKSKTVGFDFPCVAEAGYKETCEVFAQKAVMDVPYSIKLSKKGGWKKHFNGVWKGVSTYNVRGKYTSKSKDLMQE